MDQTLSVQLQPNDRGFTLFQNTFQQGKIYRFFARLFGKRERLLDLTEAYGCAGSRTSTYAGTHPVPVKLIRGTEGKTTDFDVEFHPMRESSRYRWLGILKQRLSGRDLPPIEVVELNGIYYVRDGHHRVSVARCLGQDYIDAEITKVSLIRKIN